MADAYAAKLSTAHQGFYRPELDILRFFAFLGVFLFHAFTGSPVIRNGPAFIFFANRLNYAGVFGVDLFFVLSAYLITELLLREKREFGKVDVRAFYLRRILRIWPLYFFYIGVGLIPLFNPDRSFSWRYVTAFLLLAGNWSIVFWGWPAHAIVDPLWTVSIEEQFYLLWLPVVRKLSAKGLAYSAIAMLSLATAARAVMVAIDAGTFSIWCNTLCRLDPIALGILVAVILRGRIPKFRTGTRFAMLLRGTMPVVLVANFWNLPAPESLEWVPNLFGFPIVAVGSTLVLLSALGTFAKPHGPLVYLGRISYGLYVYHALGGFVAARFIFHRHVTHLRSLILEQMVALSITILMAAVSYALLEKPFLRLKRRFELVGSRPV